MTEWLWLFLDLTLILLLLTLAWLTCATHNNQKGVTYFIAFGLLLALAWARLKAPDLALAEAVIGAGISGALLLAAIKHDDDAQSVNKLPSIKLWMVNLLTVALATLMGWGVWHGLELSDGNRLADQVLAQVPESGVTNPVTAVLLNFRAYDTLLELAVVLTAVLAVLTLNPMRKTYVPAEPILQTMLSWLVPLLVVTSGYLLWVGAHAPGGAFQAGALLASALILLQLAQPTAYQAINLNWMRFLLIVGIAVFVSVGLLMMFLNTAFLGYSSSWSGILILVIETAATFSIASALAIAYMGGRPDGWETFETSTSSGHQGGKHS
ncbi:MAG: DUF4040 domain-containing protein [Gammaproteobacteria bacterium]|nr:DUF4040 domain-containing protein [Gammaproteobacteria bacterium]